MTREFSEGEWLLIRALADGLEWPYGWSAPAAQRLLFMLDFGYATRLRASELARATLVEIRRDEYGDHWLHVLGKGCKLGKAALPSLARTVLDQYLMPRGLPITPERWSPATPLVASLEQDGARIESTRLRRVPRQFFVLAANAIQDEVPATAEKLRCASPHWKRHTHALARGAELIMVRDNLRHASVSMTSTFLHSDEVQRTRRFDQAFRSRDGRLAGPLWRCRHSLREFHNFNAYGRKLRLPCSRPLLYAMLRIFANPGRPSSGIVGDAILLARNRRSRRLMPSCIDQIF